MRNYLFLLILLAAALCAQPASAERNFPEQAKRGDMKAYKYPAMKIGDNIFRMSAGSRIYNEQNLIIMPASLQAQTAPVMYILDMRGELSQIWLLTADEAIRHPMTK